MKIGFFETMQRRFDSAYRKKVDNKEAFIDGLQASFDKYMAGEITKQQHEANVAELRRELIQEGTPET